MFNTHNPALKSIITNSAATPKIIAVIESEAGQYSPGVTDRVSSYMTANGLNLVAPPILLAGGEAIKQDSSAVKAVLAAIDQYGIDRHSYVMAIGGGALLDAVGFAAATAHRGVRLIRVPTTVLAQNDSGVGVKNSINYFGKKNFLGAFAPPFAVVNDLAFLDSLPERDWRSGMAEAVKVALIRDQAFFALLERDAPLLINRDQKAMERLIYRCAELHMKHIASGDAFETGSARPLDFGHWAAHKIEALSAYELRHGEAVAIGMALDCTYSRRAGHLESEAWARIITLLLTLGFRLWTGELDQRDALGRRAVLTGLEEFREHLGGRLTVTLLAGIGQGFEAHAIDAALVEASLLEMKERFSFPDSDAQRRLTPEPIQRAPIQRMMP